MAARFLLLVLPLLACAKSTTNSSSGAAAVAASENDEAGRQALSKAEDDWAKAVEAHDTSFLARIVAPDFHGTADSANTFGREAVLKDAANTAIQLHDLRDDDRQIRIYGDGTVGVVTARSSWRQEGGDRPGQYSGRYTETWVRQNGRWQVVAGHYTNVPPPASQP
jgi:ketosteroid isomerase-like protein